MNFLEAIKSGKPFKRACHDEYLLINDERIKPGDFIEFKGLTTKQALLKIANGQTFYWESNRLRLCEISLESLLSNDWEIKETL